MESSPHCLEESSLTIRLMKKEILKETLGEEDDKVLVDGISSETTTDCLKFYMERISDLDVKNITYGAQKMNAIVTFKSSIGEIRNDQCLQRPKKDDCTVVCGKICKLKANSAIFSNVASISEILKSKK